MYLFYFLTFNNVLLLLWALYLVKLKIIIVDKDKLVSFNIVAFSKLFDKCKKNELYRWDWHKFTCIKLIPFVVTLFLLIIYL